MEIGKWFSFLIAVGSFCTARCLGCFKGLKCRTEEDSQHQDEFQEAAKQCMTNMSNWDQPASTNGGGDYSGDEQQQGGSYRGYSNGNNNQDQQQYSNQRTRPRSRSRRDNHGRNSNNNSNNRNSNKNDSSNSSTLEHVEPCIIHCIFRQMQMLDEDAMPDKVSVTNVMMRRIQDSRVKEFIEEAVDECFELMESENKGGKCEFSKNLALCLEEKGRRNCEDWDIEFNKQNDSNMKNSNRQNSNKQGRDPQEYSNDSK